MKFWLSSEAPPPQRKRKDVVNALEQHQEYLQLKSVVAHGRMRPMQTAVITLGPNDAKSLDMKYPWRAITDNMRRYIKSMNLESEYSVRKFETAEKGVWAVTVTYEPPIVNAQPRPETPAGQKRRASRPISRTA